MNFLKQNSGLVLLMISMIAMASGQAPEKKIKILDESRPLSLKEVDELVAKNAEIQVAVPKQPTVKLVDLKSAAVDPLVVAKEEEKPKSEAPNTGDNVKLPPIPIMPSFLNDVFKPIAPAGENNNADSAVAPSGDAEKKPEGIHSILLLKTIRVQPKLENGEPAGMSSNFVIFKYLPESIQNLFGESADNEDESDEETNSASKLLGGDTDVDKKRTHLFGGDDDVADRNRIHLLGGKGDIDGKRIHIFGGDSDPDRFGIDENNKGIFTGGHEDAGPTPDEQHRIFVFSVFDRVRNMFHHMQQAIEQQQQQQQLMDSNLEQPPFIIRTDDGQTALIPNDIGYAEKQQHEQSLNKCMMLQFMRLKASMYYRTILHLLFFTGVLLFILSLAMLTIRTYRRRRYSSRHHPMSISTIDAAAGGPLSKSKMSAFRAWQGVEQSSLINGDKMILIQAPPAYDQVIIQDKNSTILTSAHPFIGNCQTSDECETKSLPPEYEEKQTEKN